MIRSKYILLILVGLLSIIHASAKKPAKPAPLTTEQKQQFAYYWYAARQAITDERYADALVLLDFCEQINPQDGETLDALGVIYDALGNSDKALSYFHRANEASPRDQWEHYSNALLEQKTDDSRYEARRVMEKALKMNPKDEHLLEHLRHFYLNEPGEWRNVIKMQDRLDALRGRDAFSTFMRVQAYSMGHKPKKAIAEIDKYLQEEPNNWDFLYMRLDIMRRTKTKPKEFFHIYEHILEYYPHNLSILNNYAYLLATTGGDLKKAERMSLETIQAEPNNPVYLDTYAWILHLQGQDDLALFYLRKAQWLADKDTRKEIDEHIRLIKK